MTTKRFTNIEHDYENAWIKCNDNGDFMIYAIYKELDESLPSLEDLLNGLSEENEQLRKENEQLKSRVDDLEYQLNYVTKCKKMCFKDIEILDKKYEKLCDENKELKRQVKETVFDIDVLIEVSAPNTERISLLLDLKEKIIETFGEWVIEYD